MVTTELNFWECAVTVELCHNLVLALPGPSERDGSWRLRLCRMDGDRLEIVDDHVHPATAMLLAGDRRHLATAVASTIMRASPGFDPHRSDASELPEELTALVLEMGETLDLFRIPEHLTVDWDGSTDVFEVGLEQVFEQGDSGDAVSFESDGRSIRLLVDCDRRVVYGEAAEPGQPFTVDQRRRLAELGWSEPGRVSDSANHARLWTLGEHCAIEDVARVLAATMGEVYGVAPGAWLTMSIRYGGGQERTPALRFLDAVEVGARYGELLRQGESLEGAVLRPERRHRYEGVNDLAELAAALLVAVNRRHALLDGNKRASITLADELLALNGYRIEGDDGELAALVWDVAAGLGEDETAERLRPFAAAGAPAEPFPNRHPAVIEALAR